MESAVGRIVSIANGQATVSVDAAVICARCAAGKGCGAGLLTGSTRLIEVELSPGSNFKAGDEVNLLLAPSHLLRAAVLAYGLPLAGIIVALGAAWVLNQSLDDRFAITFAIAGLLIGGLIGRHYLNQDACLKRLVPTISERRS